MKTSSAKAKGRRLQQFVVAKILEAFPQLTPRDVQSTPMGVTGEDIKLSEAAFKLVPYSFECKNQEAVGPIYSIWNQATRTHTPVVVIKKNNNPPLIVISIDTFFDLIKRS